MDQILPFIGWAFLPSQATSILQTIYYKITIPVGRATPQPGTPLYAKHHRRIRVLVLVLYLVYTLLQSLHDIKLAGDFFTVLNVTTNTSDREIKSRFRRLAARFHPDKLRSNEDNGYSSGDPTNPQDLHFLYLKTAQDTLLSPPLRYAYTRFGPGITRLSSPTVPTIRNYVLAGLRYNLLPSYISSIVSLIVMNYLLLPKWGSYWRYLTISFLVMVEWYFITHSDSELSTLIPSYIPISQMYQLAISRTKLGHILPPHLLPYQIVTVLRKLSISLNIFISQLAPHLSPQSPDASSPKSTIPILSRINQNLGHLHQIAMRTDAESTSLLQLQLAPFRGDEVRVGQLRDGMREGMVTGAIRQHPEVKQAIDRVVERRAREVRARRNEVGQGMDDGT